MKRAIAFFLVVGCSVAALVVVQRRKDQSAVSANAVLDLAADAQRDVLRTPMVLTRLSDQEEMQIGDEMALRYLSTLDKESDPKHREIDSEVQAVGKKLAAHAHRKLNYRFHLVADENFLNAFALPGGHVFIGLGLLHLMSTEDELASVLGHELEHIDHYHCAERVQVEAQMRKLQLGAIGDLVQIPLSVFQAGYSKDQEAEADREGLLLAAEAGYSPYGAITMFEKLEKLHAEYVIHAESPQEELSQLAMDTLMGYFRSHPLPEERIAQARRVIAEHGLTNDRSQVKLRALKDT